MNLAAPSDVSMYDNQHTYTATPGSLKNTKVVSLVQTTADAELE